MATNGTLLLADHILISREGKYVIHGTWDKATMVVEDFQTALYQHSGFHFFIRFCPERIGTHKIALRMVDSKAPLVGSYIFNHDLDHAVTSENISMACFHAVTPPINIRPQLTSENIDKPVLLIHNIVELVVDGDVVARTPLIIAFVKASVPPHAPPSSIGTPT